MTATRRRGAGIDLDALAGLEEERDFLLRSLDDLERERAAGDLDEHDYRTLRDDYTARAAAVLRAIDDGRSALPAARPRRRARLVVGALVVALAGLAAGLVVADASGTRLDGDSATGSIREGVAAQMRRAEELYQGGKAREAIDVYDEILAEDPRNAPALTYKGWLLVDVGSQAEEPPLVDRGQALLEEAVAADPTYPDAEFFLGMLFLQLREDPATAAAHFRRVLELPTAGDDLKGPARMVVGDVEAGGDGIPDGPVPTTAPAP